MCVCVVLCCRRAKRKREWLSECDENGVHPSLIGKIGRALKRHDVIVRDGRLVCIRIDENTTVPPEPVRSEAVPMLDSNTAGVSCSHSPPGHQSAITCDEVALTKPASESASESAVAPQSPHIWRFRLSSREPDSDFGGGCWNTVGMASAAAAVDSACGPLDAAAVDSECGSLVVDVSLAGSKLEINEPAGRVVCLSQRVVELLLVQTLSRLPGCIGGRGAGAAGGLGLGLHSCGPGELYGGDYTLYPPMTSQGHRHSLATLKLCWASNTHRRFSASTSAPDTPRMRARDLLSFCRIQNQVAKTAVIAAVETCEQHFPVDRQQQHASRSVALRTTVERLKVAHADIVTQRAVVDAELAEVSKLTAAAAAVATVDAIAMPSSDPLPPTALGSMENDNGSSKGKGRGLGRGKSKGGGRKGSYEPPAPCLFLPPQTHTQTHAVTGGGPVSVRPGDSDSDSGRHNATRPSVGVTFLSFTFARTSQKASVI